MLIPVLLFFYGEIICIEVTPVESEKPRILVTLNYNEEEGRCSQKMQD